jgi:hypothetical protein
LRGQNAADAAGLYNDLAADFFSELHSPIKFIHAAPGFVDTNWWVEVQWRYNVGGIMFQVSANIPPLMAARGYPGSPHLMYVFLGVWLVEV